MKKVRGEGRQTLEKSEPDYNITTIKIPCSMRQTKAKLNENFSAFRSRGRFRYFKQNTTSLKAMRKQICNSDVMLLQTSLRPEKFGKVYTKNTVQENGTALDAKSFGEKVTVAVLDIEDGMTDSVVFKTVDEAVAFVEKTYKLKVFAGRTSTSAKPGRYHLWVAFDKPIKLPLLKSYMAKKTPGQTRMLFVNKDGRPHTRVLNPNLDLSIFNNAKLIFGMRSHKWLYKSKAINKASSVIRSLGRTKDAVIQQGYTDKKLAKVKRKHRKKLGMSKSEYDRYINSSELSRDEVVYQNGKKSTVGDLVDEGKLWRGSFYSEQKSPSLSFDGKTFFDFETSTRYTVMSDESDVILFDKYVSDSGFDFASLESGVIHAVTRSGKTHAFEKQKHLIAVSRVSQVNFEAGEKMGSLKFHTMINNGPVIITHDKLLGHLRDKQFLPFLKAMGIKLIIDEAHTLCVSKDKGPIWELDAVFLSGTITKRFRPDLTHYIFQRRSGKPVIFFADRAPVRNDCVTVFSVEKNGSEWNNDMFGDHSFSKDNRHHAVDIITRDAVMTSAYREGISLKIADGLIGRSVVFPKRCINWSANDMIQALNRPSNVVGGMYIVGDASDFLQVKKNLPDFDWLWEQVKGPISSLNSKRYSFLGEAVKQRFKQMVYGASGYTMASKFGLYRYYEWHYRMELSDMYHYDNAKFPSGAKDADLLFETDEKTKQEKDDKFKFTMDDKDFVTSFSGVYSWMKMYETGAFAKVQLFKGVKMSVNALNEKLSYSLVGKRKVEEKRFVQSLRKLVGIRYYNKGGKELKKFYKSVTHVKVTGEIPFSYEEKKCELEGEDVV